MSSGRTPEETISRMQQVIRAALAPADPSGQDRAVAAQASSQMAEAQQQKLQSESPTAKPDPTQPVEPAQEAAAEVLTRPPPRTTRPLQTPPTARTPGFNRPTAILPSRQRRTTDKKQQPHSNGGNQIRQQLFSNPRDLLISALLIHRATYRPRLFIPF